MSERESSRQRKTEDLPEWAKASIGDTEQLMASYYRTSEPDAALPAVESVSTSPVRSDDKGKTGDMGAPGIRSNGDTGDQPISISLEEEVGGPVHARGEPEVAQSSGQVDQEPNFASSGQVDRSRVGEVTGEKVVRRGLSGRKRSVPAIVDRGWNAGAVFVASLDSKLGELLPGKSGALYGALYERTHGASNPVGEIQATKQELALWSGIANRNTLLKHIQHLMAVKLVKRAVSDGNTAGPVYTIRLLEELGIASETAQAFYRRVMGAGLSKGGEVGERSAAVAGA